MRVALRLGGSVAEVDLTRKPEGRYLAVVDGEEFDVHVTYLGGTRAQARIAGTIIQVEMRDGKLLVDGMPMQWALTGLERANGVGHAGGGVAMQVRPPMAGKLESLRVKPGQSVHKGDVLFVLEAMKMQNDVKAPTTGVVTAIHAQPGEAVETQRVILEIEPRK